MFVNYEPSAVLNKKDHSDLAISGQALYTRLHKKQKGEEVGRGGGGGLDLLPKEIGK